MADWQITGLIIMGGAVVGGSLLNISLKMDRIERHLETIAQALSDRSRISN